MPVYDYMCKKCGKEKFDIIEKVETEEVHICKCGEIMIRATNCNHFKLLYDPKKDIVDWDGNRTRYYDQYKKDKAEGKDVRIAQLDGDG